MVDEENAPTYEVHSLVCWRCRASQLAAQDAAEDNKGRPPAGRYYSATPKG